MIDKEAEWKERSPVCPGDLVEISGGNFTTNLNLKREGRISIGSGIDRFRLATEREIAAYKQGIININNIPEDFQTNYIPLIFN